MFLQNSNDQYAEMSPCIIFYFALYVCFILHKKFIQERIFFLISYPLILKMDISVITEINHKLETFKAARNLRSFPESIHELGTNI